MTDEGYFSGSQYDPETVRFFDVAHEGAHIRAIAAHIQHLNVVRGAEYRSIVILPTDQVARASAEMVSELISPLAWPITIADKLPHFVGPLDRSEEHTSELQSRGHLVCSLLLEKKKI